ncbi:GntR family transcriptional regulator [Enterococcus sp. BWT-B8]|uniref:GntR family transcriptional regulator n=1 Tax=Enterococcus sp. BWT-B8 TaxID=2885157 RepID=UPI001E30DE96|nr:GntR family transcriptional regulator [Enterococcus sp. BWT-B8]MCB5951000.1 GntR family transcriptional regulator [Enterococcus sp. BWT-B8]
MEKANSQTRAYELIKEMVMKAELKPGKKISKNALVKSIGIGDTPVREAILRLQKEGLFVIIPQSGTYVSHIDLQEVSEARFVRENIETTVMEEVAAVITPEQIEQLEQMLKIQQVYFESKNVDQYFHLDEEFHRFFYQITNKNFVWQWLQMLNGALNRYRFLRLEVKDLSWDNILEEHQQILELIKRKDKVQLRKTVEAHIHKVNDDAAAVIQAFPDYFVRNL